jgi:hypothetical protein
VAAWFAGISWGCADPVAFVPWPDLDGFASLVLDDGGPGLRVVSLEGGSRPTLDLPPTGELRVAAYVESTATLALTTVDDRVSIRVGGRPLPTPARAWTVPLEADAPTFTAELDPTRAWTTGLAVDEPACRPWRFVPSAVSFDGFSRTIAGPRPRSVISLGAWDGNARRRARFLSEDDLARVAIAEDVDAIFSGSDGAPWLARELSWDRVSPALEPLDAVSTASLAVFGAPRAIVEQPAPAPRFVVYTTSDALVSWDPPARPSLLAMLPSRAQVPAKILRGDDGALFVAVADTLFVVDGDRAQDVRATASSDVPFALFRRRAGGRSEIWSAALDPATTRFFAWRGGAWVPAGVLEAPAALGVVDLGGRLLAVDDGGVDVVALGESEAERWRCRVLGLPSGQKVPYAASLSDVGSAVFVEPRATGTATPGWLYPPD